jgi:hypothetical protein
LHLDIKVTNNSGVDVTIDYIHLDFRLNFASLSGAPGQGAITVSHLSGASDLQDGFTGRKLYDSGPIQGGTAEDNADYSWKQVDVSTEAMTNVTLAPGESAAFRISAAKVGDFNNGFRVDNVAISTGPLPEVVDTWAGYEKRPDGYVDTTPFLGWIWVSDVNDYVWSVNLGKYIYLPEGFVSDSGTWTYISQ